jgi:L-lysine exporter family protein LysE/ArgO
MINAFSSGFALGLSFILAIGAQNAFVLKQGLRRSNVFAICLTCAVSDAALIAAGVAGFGWLATTIPEALILVKWAGAAFLFVYGAMSLRAAINGGEALKAEGSTSTLAGALLTCLALTWLNPHVYLDTLLLIGSISSQYDDRWAFGTGAALASFVFFFSLGYGARLLAPMFEKPIAWRVLDLMICAVMWAIAVKLVLY